MARIAGITRQESEAKILKAALACLANQGDKATTFQAIAAVAGVSPALVVRFFGTREEIYPRVLSHVIETAREETRSAVEEPAKASEKLHAYFRVSLDFFRSSPEHARIYLLLYHFASFDRRYRKICTEVKDIAVRRIEQILEAGESSGEFRVSQRALTARMIHNSLNGLLISLLTNDQPQSDGSLLKHFESSILRLIAA